MQQELVGTLDQRLVYDLLVAAGAEGNGRERLSLAAGEDRASVRAWQVTYLAPDWTDLRRLTAVETLALIEHSATHSLFLYVMIITIYQRCYFVDIDAECFCASSHIVGFLRLEILAYLAEHSLAVMFVGVRTCCLRIGASVAVVVYRLLQLVVVHLVAVLAFGLLAVSLHHLVDSQALRLDSLVRSLDSFEHHGLRHLFHLAFHHHDVVIRSGYHQLEVCVLALLEGRVNHHLAIYTRYTYLAHRTLERYIRACERSTCCQTGNALRHVDTVSRIHRYVDEGLCVIIGREERTKGAVDQTGNQDLIIRCFTFAAGESTRETSCGRKFLFVLYGQGHKIRTRNRIFGGADSSQNHRVAEGRHHGSISLFGQFACLQFDYSSVRESNLFGYNIHLFFRHLRSPFATLLIIRPTKSRAKLLQIFGICKILIEKKSSVLVQGSFFG